MAFNLNKFYTWCIQTCNAPDVRYSLEYRAQQTVNGITYYDCSSFVYYALIAGGFENLPGYPFVTYDMIPYLTAGGWHEVDAGGEILPGDIGWNLEHVEVAYARGERGVAVFMGAHDTYEQNPEAEVSIGVGGDPNVPRSFSRIFRYGEGGATGYGASMYVVAALAGNAWVESYLNPTTTKFSDTAAGLWLWKASRLDAFRDWCDQEVLQYDDPQAQMRYLVEEDYWTGTFGGITSLSDFMSSSSDDIDMLTEAFLNCWERSTPSYLQDRIDFANDAFNYIDANAQDTDIISWETVPEDPQEQHISRDQALRNAVLLFRFFSAGGGGGGTPSEPLPAKMPIWMMIKYHI